MSLYFKCPMWLVKAIIMWHWTDSRFLPDEWQNLIHQPENHIQASDFCKN